ncbi:MAG: hypothetical protein P1U85_17740 [Verrucomicrobiales bacterium]|nr:hypothetical protein [Verrucomicrobiales bacterium]
MYTITSNKATGFLWKTREGKVVLFLLLALLLLEIGARSFEERLSADLAHFSELPQAADRLREGSRDGSVLVIGNSLAREGIDTERMREAFGNVEFFHPDGSSVVEWSWGLRRYFLSQGSIPDRILVITARSHLVDHVVAPEKLGAYLVGDENIGSALESLDNHEATARFLLGRVSHLFANRSRVRPLIGYRFLPGFEEAWPLLASAGMEAQLAIEGEEALVSRSLVALPRLVAFAKKSGSELIVVKIPMVADYDLPDDVVEILESNEIRLIDLSDLDGISESSFRDGYHLNREGASITTKALLDALVNTP